MVAYSFKKQFAGPILSGTKAQTIRAERAGKSRHARPGEMVQLYTGMRTRYCRLLGTAKCLEVTPVRLTFYRQHGPGNFWIGNRHLSCAEMESFARADGFGSSGFAVLEMTEFWFDTHPPDQGDDIDFRGVLIGWQALTPADPLDIAGAA